MQRSGPGGRHAAARGAEAITASASAASCGCCTGPRTTARCSRGAALVGRGHLAAVGRDPATRPEALAESVPAEPAAERGRGAARHATYARIHHHREPWHRALRQLLDTHRHSAIDQPDWRRQRPVAAGPGHARRAWCACCSYLAAQPYARLLRDALPIAGVDGTLIGRMRGTPAENNVHAKTGSMTLRALPGRLRHQRDGRAPGLRHHAQQL